MPRSGIAGSYGNSIFRVFFLILFIYLFYYYYFFWLPLGLRCCARAFSSCSKQGLLFVAVLRFLIVVASLVVKHRL